VPPSGQSDLAPGAPDPNEVVKVQVALVRSSPGRTARASGTRTVDCLYFTGHGHYRSGRGGRHGCLALSWVNARIELGSAASVGAARAILPFSGAWFFGFDVGHPLPAGTWTAFVRAINRAGIGDPSIRDQYRNSPYRYVFACQPRKC
jgi:hypothetical protein